MKTRFTECVKRVSCIWIPDRDRWSSLPQCATTRTWMIHALRNSDFEEERCLGPQITNWLMRNLTRSEMPPHLIGRPSFNVGEVISGAFGVFNEPESSARHPGLYRTQDADSFRRVLLVGVVGRCVSPSVF